MSETFAGIEINVANLDPMIVELLRGVQEAFAQVSSGKSEFEGGVGENTFRAGVADGTLSFERVSPAGAPLILPEGRRLQHSHSPMFENDLEGVGLAKGIVDVTAISIQVSEAVTCTLQMPSGEIGVENDDIRVLIASVAVLLDGIAKGDGRHLGTPDDETARGMGGAVQARFIKAALSVYQKAKANS